jgi:diguanylate cyclase (GGDEF)-like protein
MECFPEFQEHFNLFKNDENYIDYFITFAHSALDTDLIYARDVMEYVLKISDEMNYSIGRAWCLSYLGWYYYYVSDYYKAIELHTEGNRIFTESNHAKGITFTCNSLLSDYSQLGLYDRAIEWGLLGISIAERENDHETLPVILGNTGVTYIDLEYYHEAKELFEQLNSLPYKIRPTIKGLWYQAMANIEYHLGNLEQAVSYLESGTEIAEEEKYEILKAEILYVSAEIKGKQGKDQEAIEDFKRALDISLKNNEMYLTSTILVKWSGYQISVTDYEGALANLLRAHNTAEQTKSKPLLLEIYKALSCTYKLSGNFQEALKYLELHCVCQREMFNNVSSLSLAKMKNSETKRQASAYKSLYNEIALISTIGQKLTSNLNLASILDTVYEEINGLLKAEVFGIAIYKENKGILDYKLFIDSNKRIDMGNIAISDETSFGAYCFRNKIDIIINDIEKEYTKYVSKLNTFDPSGGCTNSLIYCPLFIEDKAIGFISVQSYEKNVYSINDLNVLKALGSYVAIALKNASLFDTIQNIANYDSLTGLLNRREIFINGEMAFYRFKRYFEDLCVAMIDIDGFKKINDIYGHNAGDIVIKNVAEIIKTSIRVSDYAGRYGGDEFLVILPRTTSKNAYALLERMRKAVEECEIYYNDDIILKVTISVGLFQISKETATFDESVVYSDIELYKSKESGRNKVVCK